MQKKWLFSILALLLTVSAVGAYIFIRSPKEIEKINPRRGLIVESVYGLGTVLAPRTFQVKTAVSQSIREIFVKEGDRVSAGAALIQFDDPGVRRAPFSGTVTSIPSKRGEILFPSTVALTLVDLSDLILEVSLEQQAVLSVKRDQLAHVSFESLRGNRIEAKVQSVFPREAQFIVRLSIDKFPEGILPGMTADVAIEIGRKENALSIPLRAISMGKVNLMRNGKVLKETVQVGVIDGEWAEITSSNIQSSDEIIVRQK